MLKVALTPVLDDPLEVETVDGEIVLTTPNGAPSLTPQAARITAERLLAAAAELAH